MLPFVSFDHLAGILIAPFIGSFLSVLVVRLPAAAPVVVSRSRCPACGHVLTPLDLMPIVSWLWLGGRCRHCRAPIARLYPVLEALAVLVALWAATELDGALYWTSCALGWTLLALAATDFREMILPDALTLPLVAAGLLVGAVFDAGALVEHVVGAAAGFLVLYGIGLVYRRLRGREGLGLGDAKLLAAAGAWVTWSGLPSVVLVAGALALVVVAIARIAGHRFAAGDPVPFGAFLALGFWFVWLYGPLSF